MRVFTSPSMERSTEIHRSTREPDRVTRVRGEVGKTASGGTDLAFEFGLNGHDLRSWFRRWVDRELLAGGFGIRSEVCEDGREKASEDVTMWGGEEEGLP